MSKKFLKTAIIAFMISLFTPHFTELSVAMDPLEELSDLLMRGSTNVMCVRPHRPDGEKQFMYKCLKLHPSQMTAEEMIVTRHPKDKIKAGHIPDDLQRISTVSTIIALPKSDISQYMKEDELLIDLVTVTSKSLNDPKKLEHVKQTSIVTEGTDGCCIQ